jgi:outer membrane protein TolC
MFRNNDLVVSIFFVITLSGCSSVAQLNSFEGVESLVQKQLGNVQLINPTQQNKTLVQEKTTQLLSTHLGMEQAVQLALLHSRQLQAQYAKLGIAEADLIQAGRLKNPGLSYGVNTHNAEKEYESFVLFDLLGLLTMSQRTEIATHQLESAKILAAKDTLSLAYQVKKAWIMAVASQQELIYYNQLMQAAEAGAELASRMKKAGNLSLLAEDRQSVFLAEVVVKRERIRQENTKLKENLIRLLGIASPDSIRLPNRLPDIPKQKREIDLDLATALNQRLDLLIAREETDALAKSLGLTKRTSWINLLEVGYSNTDVNNNASKTGYSIEFKLPIFDWGDARNAKAEAIYKQSVLQAEDVVIRAQSELRERYDAYLANDRLVSHYKNDIIPLRQRISDENMLRYNGMLVGVFELLADARAQIASVNDYLNAQRDYWLSDAALTASVQGVESAMSGIKSTMSVTENDNAGH